MGEGTCYYRAESHQRMDVAFVGANEAQASQKCVTSLILREP